MQYTASSFAEPLLAPFSKALEVDVHRDGPDGCFPGSAKYDVHLRDLAGERFIVPAFRWFLRAMARISALQQGRIQLYLVYILAALIALIVWQFASPFGG
jgi:hydrogenase-4 component B